MSVRPATPAEVDGAADEAEIPVYVETGPFAGMTFLANRNDPSLKDALQNKTALVQPGAVLLPPPPLALTRITPNPAFLNPGLTTLTIEGTGFSPSTQVNIEGAGWTKNPVTFVSPTRITFQEDLKMNYGLGPLNVHVRNDQTLDVGSVPKIATILEYPSTPIAPGGGPIIAPAGVPVVTIKDVGGTLTLDIDGAQPALKPLSTTPQPIRLALEPGLTPELAFGAPFPDYPTKSADSKAVIGGATVDLKKLMTGDAAAFSADFGGNWSSNAFGTALLVGGTFSLKLDGTTPALEWASVPVIAGWRDAKTTAQLVHLLATRDENYAWAWSDFGAPVNTSYAHWFADGTTIQAAMIALTKSPGEPFLGPLTVPPVPLTGVTAAFTKDAAFTPTDRKVVYTVNFPADTLVGQWVILHARVEYTVGGVANAIQSKHIVAGQTKVEFNFTYDRDGFHSATSFIGQTLLPNANLSLP
jgi:hypothetical protein